MTNAIGVYKPVSDELQIFLVITEFVDNDTAQNAAMKIVCEKCYFEMKEVNLGHS
jgi:hypothetical protein